MALDIIREQKMIRMLFYSLIQSSEFIATNPTQVEQFVNRVSKFIRERIFIEEDTRDAKEVVVELLEILGWKSIVVDYDISRGQGKIILGKNKYFVNEVSDLNGALIVLRAFLEGICFYLIKAPVTVKAILSLSSASNYEITFTKKIEKIITVEEKPTLIPKERTDMGIHEDLTIESVLNPIFSKSIPSFILFETLWKVVTESYVANYSIEGDVEIKEVLKNPSMENLSLVIMKLTEKDTEQNILNMAEIIGEFIVKILKTKVSGSLTEKLQTTLRDSGSKNILIYYDCRAFCGDKQFVNRCIFIRGMWVGILGEIYGIPLTIKELLHAGKRDLYCMIELMPKKAA